jgi:hypothetical protein
MTLVVRPFARVSSTCGGTGRDHLDEEFEAPVGPHHRQDLEQSSPGPGPSAATIEGCGVQILILEIDDLARGSMGSEPTDGVEHGVHGVTQLPFACRQRSLGGSLFGDVET